MPATPVVLFATLFVASVHSDHVQTLLSLLFSALHRRSSNEPRWVRGQQPPRKVLRQTQNTRILNSAFRLFLGCSRSLVWVRVACAAEQICVWQRARCDCWVCSRVLQLKRVWSESPFPSLFTLQTSGITGGVGVVVCAF